MFAIFASLMSSTTILSLMTFLELIITFVLLLLYLVALLLLLILLAPPEALIAALIPSTHILHSSALAQITSSDLDEVNTEKQCSGEGIMLLLLLRCNSRAKT